MESTWLSPLQALNRVEAHPIGMVAVGSPEEAAALKRFEEFFGSMTVEKARHETAQVYAPNALLYDTLKLVEGASAIAEYFEATAKRASGVTVRVEDVARVSERHYLRWCMDITWSRFKKGQTTRSAGVTLLRFDGEGRVALHYDFWDSAGGFFEHLPLLGPLIRAVKRRA